MQVLANAVDAKDSYTGGHAHRMATLALAVGRRLGFTAAQLESLYWGTILHDVGKIGVPDAIITKPGRLNEEEWTIMRRHPEIGAEILKPVPALKEAALMVRHHHERWDGRGYPDGLKGENIPLGARILAVVDAYSAMLDERIYKKAKTPAETIAELERCAGSQFDPQVVKVFLEVLASKEND